MSHIPDGSFTLSKRPAAFPSGVWDYAIGGQGPYVTTASGRQYLDCMCALGALTVGHAHPKIVEAVSAQMARGSIFSLPSCLEERVAGRLCDVIPCAERVRVVKTGSEACSAAVRIARVATGRDVVLTTTTSYHGWHDGFAATKPRHPGVPDMLEELTLTFGYNSIEGFKAAIEESVHLSDALPAAVILEPVQGEPPVDGFLEKLVAIARDKGIVVVFDEMLCGGRLRVGGAQEFYNVTPDLATFGKAFGGGLPFAFVCGKADLMQHAWPVSGTYSGDALALAAADAMLDLYQEEGIIDALWANGHALLSGLRSIVPPGGPTIVFHGHDPRFWFTFGGPVDERLAKSVFVQKCASGGVLVHPAVVFASAAMSARQVMLAADVMASALADVLSAIDHGSLAAELVGEPYQDSVR